MTYWNSSYSWSFAFCYKANESAMACSISSLSLYISSIWSWTLSSTLSGNKKNNYFHLGFSFLPPPRVLCFWRSWFFWTFQSCRTQGFEWIFFCHFWILGLWGCTFREFFKWFRFIKRYFRWGWCKWRWIIGRFWYTRTCFIRCLRNGSNFLRWNREEGFSRWGRRGIAWWSRKPTRLLYWVFRRVVLIFVRVWRNRRANQAWWIILKKDIEVKVGGLKKVLNWCITDKKV